MSSERRQISGERMLAILLIFPMLGPIVGALVFLVVLTIVGMLTLGLGALLMGPMYLGFWFTSLYVVLGIPFLLTGLLYALAARFFAPESLLTALVAAGIAFPGYLGALYWTTGTLEISTRALGPGFWSDPWNILNALLGTVACWWLVRNRDEPRWF
jgi:hypothetical protein